MGAHASRKAVICASVRGVSASNFTSPGAAGYHCRSAPLAMFAERDELLSLA